MVARPLPQTIPAFRIASPVALPPSRLQFDEPDTHTMAGTNMGAASRIMCIENLPGHLIEASAKANNRDYHALAREFGDAIAIIAAGDQERLLRRQRSIS